MGLAVAEDDCAANVLEMPCDDLGSRRARTVGEHHERPAERDGVAVGYRKASEVAHVLDLHDGAVRNEKRREKHRLPQGAAAVAAEVKYKPADVLGAELPDQPCNVHRATAETGILRTLVHRAVEAGKVDVADFVREAAERDRLDAPRSGLVLELYLVADELDLLLRRTRRIGAGNDLERYARALRPAYLLDRLLHRLPHDVFHLAVFLPDADDLVALLYASVAVNRPARHDLDDLERTLVHLENRADAAKRQAHLHVEVLLGRGRHVVGVRVVGARHGGKIVLENRLFVWFGEDRVVLVVLLHEASGGIDLVRRLVELGAENLDKRLVLEPPAPMVFRLLLRLRPGRILALHAIRLVRRKVPLHRREEVRHELHALGETAAVEVVDVEAEGRIARVQLVVEQVLALRELVKVGLEEHGVVEVVESHEVSPRLTRDVVVELLLEDVVFRQHVADPAGDLPVVVLRLNFRGKCAARRDQRQGQREWNRSLHELLSISATRRSSSAGGITTRSVAKPFASSHEFITTAPCTSAICCLNVSDANARTGVTAPFQPAAASAVLTSCASFFACSRGSRSGSRPSRSMRPSSTVTLPRQYFVSTANTPAGPATTWSTCLPSATKSLKTW